MKVALMFRLIFYLIVSIFLISILRAVVGVVLKGFASMFQNAQPPSRRPVQPGGIPLTGELKRDPVCGTYTVASNAIQQNVNGQTYYFCSSRCRDEYLATARH